VDAQFFVWDLRTADPDLPPLLLRRDSAGDQIFRDGQWHETGMIVEWQFGEANSVEEITEEEARKFARAAFR
jgi:hypothetical protein